jgi:hypothetical protein
MYRHINQNQSAQRWRQYIPPKCWDKPNVLCGVKTKKMFIVLTTPALKIQELSAVYW